MGASLRELRQVCQEPVRASNDVAGLLFGDHASLPITKLMVDLRLSPTWASIGFFLAGLAGFVLEIGAGIWAVAGAVLLLFYYVLDCVDGEVARWQRVCDVKWGYFDYLFHMVVKPLAFFGVGLGTYRELGHALPLGAAFAAATATLWLKMFLAVPGIVFLREVLKPARAVSGSQNNVAPAMTTAQSPASSPASALPFRLRLDMVTLRALSTNFDVGLLLLLAASLADLVVEPFHLGPLGPLNFRASWLCYYAVILPVDFLDYVFTYVRRGHFTKEMTRLLSLAHHFTLSASSGEDPRGDAP